MEGDRYIVESNGVNMIESIPLNWEVRKENSDGSGDEYFSIFIGGMGEGHICIFKKGILTISNMMYSSDDPPLRFKIENLREASKIIYSFSQGMNDDLVGTIYSQL
tara:strand:+ start:23731 stop:24048 length:318 start_codon:yes stop_codon:yes gene_type:complete